MARRAENQGEPMTAELELRADQAALTLFGQASPHQILTQATAIADTIAPLIRQRNLYKRIGNSEHVYIEAWTLAGTMLGVFAITLRTWEIGADEGYGATVQARTLGGQIVGQTDAVVMRSEEVGGKRKWEDAPAFQLISMAQTRASSKALRMPLGFIMQLAGYDTTPAEEVEAAAARGETVSGGKGTAPGWRDLAEQQRAHASIGELVDQHGLRQWVAEWLESKSYQRPLAKGQLSQLRRAIERELRESGRQGGHDDVAPPAGATSAAGRPPASAADPDDASPVQPAGGEAEGHPGLASNHTETGEQP
jgi:hypothetical protein